MLGQRRGRRLNSEAALGELWVTSPKLFLIHIPANTKHLYNIYTVLIQR